MLSMDPRRDPRTDPLVLTVPADAASGPCRCAQPNCGHVAQLRCAMCHLGFCGLHLQRRHVIDAHLARERVRVFCPGCDPGL